MTLQDAAKPATARFKHCNGKKRVDSLKQCKDNLQAATWLYFCQRFPKNEEGTQRCGSYNSKRQKKNNLAYNAGK